MANHIPFGGTAADACDEAIEHGSDTIYKRNGEQYCVQKASKNYVECVYLRRPLIGGIPQHRTAIFNYDDKTGLYNFTETDLAAGTQAVGTLNQKGALHGTYKKTGEDHHKATHPMEESEYINGQLIKKREYTWNNGAPVKDKNGVNAFTDKNFVNGVEVKPKKNFFQKVGESLLTDTAFIWNKMGTTDKFVVGGLLASGLVPAFGFIGTLLAAGGALYGAKQTRGILQKRTQRMIANKEQEEAQQRHLANIQQQQTTMIQTRATLAAQLKAQGQTPEEIATALGKGETAPAAPPMAPMSGGGGGGGQQQKQPGFWAGAAGGGAWLGRSIGRGIVVAGTLGLIGVGLFNYLTNSDIGAKDIIRKGMDMGKGGKELGKAIKEGRVGELVEETRELPANDLNSKNNPLNKEAHILNDIHEFVGPDGKPTGYYTLHVTGQDFSKQDAPSGSHSEIYRHVKEPEKRAILKDDPEGDETMIINVGGDGGSSVNRTVLNKIIRTSEDTSENGWRTEVILLGMLAEGANTQLGDRKSALNHIKGKSVVRVDGVEKEENRLTQIKGLGDEITKQVGVGVLKFYKTNALK